MSERLTSRLTDEQVEQARLTPVSEVVARYVQLRPDGREFWGTCPFHDDSNPSLSVVDHKGFYHCFGCGAHGDGPDFLQNHLGLSFPDAVRQIVGDTPPEARQAPSLEAGAKASPEPEWRPLLPVLEDAPPLFDDDGRVRVYNPKLSRDGRPKGWRRWPRPKLVHPYRDQEGRLLGYVVRLEFTDGEKITPQIVFAEHTATGERAWVVATFPRPRPLYGLDRLRRHGFSSTGARRAVIVVEGEKAADWLQEALPSNPVLAWPGGAAAAHMVDLSPLQGWPVVAWPDCDLAGLRAFHGAYSKHGAWRPGLLELLREAGADPARLKVVDLSREMAQVEAGEREEGWDAADAVERARREQTKTDQRLWRWLKRRVTHIDELERPEALRRHDPSPEPDPDPGGAPARSPEPPTENSVPGPTYPDEGVPVEDARARIAPVIRSFFDRIVAWKKGDRGADVDPPQVAAFIDMGLGKSDRVRRHIARHVEAHDTSARYTSDDFKAQLHRDLKRGVVAVGTHDLAREYVDALRELGVSVAHWRGRDHDDPVSGEPVCYDRDSIRQAIAVGLPPESSVCERQIRDQDGEKHWFRCPFHPDSPEALAGGPACIYQRQKVDAKNADVIVTTHAALFEERPSAIGSRSWMVVDEDFTGHGLRGVSGPQQPMSLVEIGAKAQVLTKDDKPDLEQSRRLTDHRRAVTDSLAAQDLGERGRAYADVAALHAAGLTAFELREAAHLEEDTRVPAPMHPRMRKERRREVYERAAYNATVPYRARMFRLLADAIDAGQDVAAGVEIVERTDDEGAPIRGVRLRWRADIRETWPDATLLLDGTGREEIARRFLPRLEVADRITAQTPHVTVRQVYDRPFSARTLDPDGQRAKEAKTARRHLRDVHAYIQARAWAFDTGRTDGAPDVLVVCQEAIKAHLREFVFRPNVELAHFNAVRGLDRWRDVRALIVVGRPLPSATAVEAHHAALTNTSPAARPEHAWWYDETTRALRMADGSAMPVKTAIHPDEFCEAIRWSICEAELMQVVGRGRGVNRTAETPLQVDILADVVLPLTIHQAANWKNYQPGPWDLMLAAGVATENAADAARLRPDLWRKGAGARQALNRVRRSVTHGYRGESLNSHVSHSSGLNALGEPGVRSATYQRQAAGTKPARAHYDPAMVREPALLLEAAVGELASFEDDDAPDAARELADLTASRSTAGQCSVQAGSPPRAKSTSSVQPVTDLSPGGMPGGGAGPIPPKRPRRRQAETAAVAADCLETTGADPPGE
jgi:putative DNA primase/helicase